jgi:hypothetical protein
VEAIGGKSAPPGGGDWGVIGGNGGAGLPLQEVVEEEALAEMLKTATKQSETDREKYLQEQRDMDKYR